MLSEHPFCLSEEAILEGKGEESAFASASQLTDV
jgi:hypothetical protein